MKKFLEELAKNRSHLTDEPPTNTEADRQRKRLSQIYKSHIGKRALHVSKILKESRVVTIVEVKEHYVRVSYRYYGMDYGGVIYSCINYLSLLCGDDRLDVE